MARTAAEANLPDAKAPPDLAHPGQARAESSGIPAFAPGTEHPARGRAETARSVADQIRQGVAASDGGAIDIQLSPEELGRVRLILQTSDGTLSVAIQAERPETMELMRRNIELLARDFRDQGYTGVSFSFQQGGDPQRRAWSPSRTGELAGIGDVSLPPTPPLPASRDRAVSPGIDMRL